MQLQGGFWTLNPSPTLTFPGHFCWSLSQVAAVKFQGAHAELLAGVVEDEPAGLGSVEVSLCVLGTSRCDLTASAMLDFPLCPYLPFTLHPPREGGT